MNAWLFVIGVKQLLANGDSDCSSTHISLLLWLAPTDLDTKKIFVFLLATSCLLITLSNIRKGHKFLKHMEKVEIWSGVTDA